MIYAKLMNALFGDTAATWGTIFITSYLVAVLLFMIGYGKQNHFVAFLFFTSCFIALNSCNMFAVTKCNWGENDCSLFVHLVIFGIGNLAMVGAVVRYCEQG